MRTITELILSLIAFGVALIVVLVGYLAFSVGYLLWWLVTTPFKKEGGSNENSV